MKKTIWNKHMPTLFGLLLIVFSITVTSFLVNKGVIFVSNASLTLNPQDVRITNISSNSFTVTYFTQQKVIGSIDFGTSNSLGQIALDDRNQSGNVSAYTIHSITAKRLSPSTTYLFSITSGKQTFLNNGSLYSITTGPVLPNPTSQSITGSVVLPNGQNPSEGIVYLTADNAQVLSVLLKADGSYNIPVSSLRDSSLASYVNFSPNSIITLLAIGDSMESTASISSQTTNVPTITLSNNYDFTISQAPVASISAQAEFPILPSSSTSASKSVAPSITTPQHNESFSDQQPLFTGTAPPNQTVKVTVHSQQVITQNVISNANGLWSFRPSTPLAPGQHTIYIITSDANGILKTISQSFIVYASGTEVSQSATPSAVITITPSPIPTASPTPKPTSTPIPTASPTPKPTITPIIANVATSSALPATGNSSIVFVGLIGIGAAFLGLMTFLLIN